MIHMAAAVALAAAVCRTQTDHRRRLRLLLLFLCAVAAHIQHTHILPEWHNLAAAFATRPEAASDEHASVRNQYVQESASRLIWSLCN